MLAKRGETLVATFELMEGSGDSTLTVQGAVSVRNNGELGIANGSTLNAGGNFVSVNGGNLRTYTSGSGAQNPASITASTLAIGSGMANDTTTVEICADGASFGVLQVTGNIDWRSGVLYSGVDATNPGTRDRFVCLTGTFKVNAAAGKGVADGYVEIDPVGNPAAGAEYAVLEAQDKGFSDTAGLGALPTIDGTWKWKPNTTYTSKVWYIQRTE